MVHLEEERRYGLGVAAFEVGSGYSRQEPLQRISRRLLAGLVDATSQSAHLAVLHGRDVLYVVEERAPGRPPLVTDVGVRLPAHLTASGRAILAALPAPQVRALYPDRTAFVDRHGTGPASLSALRAVLAETRQRGFATESGEVTPGLRQRRRAGARPQRAPGRRHRRHLRGSRSRPGPRDGRRAARGRRAHDPAGRSAPDPVAGPGPGSRQLDRRRSSSRPSAPVASTLHANRVPGSIEGRASGEGCRRATPARVTSPSSAR